MDQLTEKIYHKDCCVNCLCRTDQKNQRVKVNVEWLVKFCIAKRIDYQKYKWLCNKCYKFLLELKNAGKDADDITKLWPEIGKPSPLAEPINDVINDIRKSFSNS